MKEIIIIKENIPRIKTFLEQENISYEIRNILGPGLIKMAVIA